MSKGRSKGATTVSAGLGVGGAGIQGKGKRQRARRGRGHGFQGYADIASTRHRFLRGNLLGRRSCASGCRAVIPILDLTLNP